MKEETKKISQKKKLYAEVQKDFEAEFVLPEIEERKERLQKIRQMH